MSNKSSNWDERYANPEYYYGIEPNSFLVSQRELFFKGANVLCLAEGEGRNAVFLAKLGCKVTAVDGSQVGLEKLAKLAKQNNVEVTSICSDLSIFLIEENSWDFIVSILCHLPSELRKIVHDRSIRGLRKNGFFILEAYTPAQIPLATGGPKDPDMMPTLSMLKPELAGLKFILEKEINRNISEGIGHEGESAVVQVVAQKISLDSSK